MRAIILGGFLGSGKTTILMKMARTFISMGKKVAVLVNDIGSIGVDGKTIKAEGYNTVELPDGCVCCSLASELQISVRNVIRDLDPEIMLIEPTGLALPSKIIEAIEFIPNIDPNVKMPDRMDIIGVIDAVRFPIFAMKKEKFVLDQLKGSKLVVMNKMDIASDKCKADSEMWLALNVGKIPVYKVSALTGEGMDAAMEAIVNE